MQFIELSISIITLTIIIPLAAYKIYNNVNKVIYKGKERMEGKTVIVTGANSGIGAETVKDLARRGARVIMLCRDTVKGEKVRKDIVDSTGNTDVILKYVDFSSLASVRQCANGILREEFCIHVLVNNAAGHGLGLGSFSSDGLQVIMQTNYFGPFLLTNLLLDRIKVSAPSRIVNVSSNLHEWAKLDLDDLEQNNCKSEMVLYANTKLANNLFTTALTEKLKGTGVTANCLHPGAVNTDIFRNWGELRQYLWKQFLATFHKNAWEGAQTSIFLCVSPTVENTSGKYYIDCREVAPSKESLDVNLATRLWELSEQAVKLPKRTG